MDHYLKKLCLLPCFALVTNFYALVCVVIAQGKGVLLGGPHKGNTSFPASQG
jgi:hypothetical protein